MSIWNPHLHTAIEAARKAGSYQRHRFTSPLGVELKGDNDLATEVDRKSERLIVDHLLTHFPEYAILAEEGEYPQKGSQPRWIIDPLDGMVTGLDGAAYSIFNNRIVARDGSP